MENTDNLESAQPLTFNEQIDAFYTNYSRGEIGIYEFVKRGMELYAKTLDFFSVKKGRPATTISTLQEINESSKSKEIYQKGYNSKDRIDNLKVINQLKDLISPDVFSLLNSTFLLPLTGSATDQKSKARWTRFILDIEKANLSQKMKDSYFLICMKIGVRRKISETINTQLNYKSLARKTVPNPSLTLTSLLNSDKPGSEGLNFALGYYAKLDEKLNDILSAKLENEEDIEKVKRCFTALFFLQPEIHSRSARSHDFRAVVYKLMDVGEIDLAERVTRDKIIREPYDFSDVPREVMNVTEKNVRDHYSHIKSSKEGSWSQFLQDIRSRQIEMAKNESNVATAQEIEMYTRLQIAFLLAEGVTLSNEEPLEFKFLARQEDAKDRKREIEEAKSKREKRSQRLLAENDALVDEMQKYLGTLMTGTVGSGKNKGREGTYYAYAIVVSGLASHRRQRIYLAHFGPEKDYRNVVVLLLYSFQKKIEKGDFKVQGHTKVVIKEPKSFSEVEPFIIPEETK